MCCTHDACSRSACTCRYSGCRSGCFSSAMRGCWKSHNREVWCSHLQGAGQRGLRLVQHSKSPSPTLAHNTAQSLSLCKPTAATTCLPVFGDSLCIAAKLDITKAVVCTIRCKCCQTLVARVGSEHTAYTVLFAASMGLAAPSLAVAAAVSPFSRRWKGP